MAKEQLKPKKGVVVAEINGVKYFKLQSNYPGDYTKNCGLLGQEIDENFYFLRSNDIDKMSVENGILKLTRVDGDILTADVSMPYTFEFDQKTGKLIITDGNGDVQVLEGFVVEGKDVRVATDASLNGDGTKGNPLRISELEKTGTYAPADKFLDMAVYDYYSRASEDSHNYYYYGPSEEPFEDTKPEDYIELGGVPTEVTYDSPKYIKVRKNINLPDGSKLGAGYRIVTREAVDNFGLLYNYDGVKKIQEALDATGSLWRIPTRRDWALMLNAAEYCEDDRNHDTKCVNEWTGKNAGARAKALTLWRWSNRRESGLPVAGEDSLPIAGTNKFTVYPVGYADGSRGAEDKDFDLEAFTKKASYWSITPANCNGDNCSSNVFTRTFAYDTRKVLQESSKPSSRMSIRLVKDFKPGQMDANEVENILGYDMPVVLLTNDETGYSKLWTSINVGFREPQYDGVYSNEWSAATGTDRGAEIVFYINEWDGKDWHKKQMGEGESIVLIDGGKDESGNTIYNHEWRIYSGETEPILVDTADALKEEFQKEIDAINDRIDEEISARTEAIEDLQEQIDDIVSGTEEEIKVLEEKINEEVSARTAADEELQEEIDGLQIVEVAVDNVNVLKAYELHDINGEKKGATIEIPKDDVAGFKFIGVGYAGATIDPTTGEFTYWPETGDTEVLYIVYKTDDEIYKLAEISLESLIHEDEFGDGLKVTDHVVNVILDSENEDEYFTIVPKTNENPGGLKLHGVAAIRTDLEAEVARAQSAETALQEDIDEEVERAEQAEAELDEKIDAETARAQSAETALQEDIDAEVERSKNIDTNIARDVIGVNGSFSGNAEEGFAIDFAYVEYQETEETPTVEPVVMATVPTHDDIINSGDTAPLYINVGGVVYKIAPTSNYISDAKNVFEAIKALDNEAKNIDERVDDVETEIDALSEKVDELDEKVTDLESDVEEISGNVSTLTAALADEVSARTAADEELAGQDIAEDGHVMTVDQLTLKRNNNEDVVIPLNFNFGSVMPLVG